MTDFFENKIVQWLMCFFLVILVLVSLFLGVFAINSWKNNSPIATDLLFTITTPTGNILFGVLLLISAVGGSLFWAHEINEILK